ncbi:hypothetical protein YB2330_005820 [Saitoella coloradoensis]
MWCDCCCIFLPLRLGAIILSSLMLIYQTIGIYLLYTYSSILPFSSYETYFYLATSALQLLTTFLSLIALGIRSWVLTRMVCWTWLPLLLLGGVRGGVMAYMLQKGVYSVEWVCNQNATSTLTANSTYITNTTTGIESKLCAVGAQGVVEYAAIALVVDYVLMCYLAFLVWRYRAYLLTLARFPKIDYASLYT